MSWTTVETTYTIAGRVTDASSNPIPGVTILAGSGITATTDASGYYTMTSVMAGTYTLAPRLSGYTFLPVTRTVSVPPEATGQDFLGATRPSPILYDQMDNPGENSNAVSSQNFETTLDDFDSEAADDFVFPGSIPGWAISTVEVIGVGTTAPSANVRFYADSGSNLPGALVYSVTVATSLISGTTALNLNPPVVLSPGGHYWVSVQANLDFAGGGQWYWKGRTSLNNSPSAWQNPGQGQVVDCPTFQLRAETCLVDQTEPDMVFRLRGIINGTSAVSGRITDALNNPIPGVAVSAGAGLSATTDVSGDYMLPYVFTGTYTLTPTLNGYAFSPVTRTVSVPPDQPDQDFIGFPISTISGRVTDAGSNPISGVIISADNGISAAADASGYYTIAVALSPGTSIISTTYTLTPTLSGYTFSPVTRTVSVPPDALGQDFTGATISLISGRVTDRSSSPMPGVILSAEGDIGATARLSISATTDLSGYYTFTNVLSGAYTLTPALGSYNFFPAARTVSVPPDRTGQDFVGSLLRYIWLPLVTK